MDVYIFGYGGSEGTPIKVTTMRVFDSIEAIIELLLKEFNSHESYYYNNNESKFDQFMKRWRNPPKVYIAKMNDELLKPKLINSKKWREHISDFGNKYLEKVAKLLLNGDIELTKQGALID
jgi:hypothetical protein